MPSNKKRTIEQMHQLASDRRGECLSSEYFNVETHLTWKCSEGHVWQATPHAVFGGTWCKKCSHIRSRNTIEDARNLAYRRGFKCLSQTYQHSTSPMIWECPNGHSWNASYSSIKSGYGCHKCSGNITEEKCRFIIEQLTGKDFPTLNLLDGRRLQIDGYNEETRSGFEYNGEQHYIYVRYIHKTEANFLEQQERDRLKQHPDLARIATADYLNELYYQENLRITDIADLFTEKHQIPASYNSIRKVMIDRGIKLKPKSCRDYQRSRGAVLI